MGGSSTQCTNPYPTRLRASDYEQRISSGVVRAMWGDLESIITKLRKRHLEWLGYVTRMPNHMIPRICFVCLAASDTSIS